ncbi:EamA family transporter [Ferrimonas pelagia]|uniref:Carboxylate/amino acid/amine transporter n=1 Tax=Ferrimonas pelagia TaxID=1177826 RepID=A0ABP9EFU7_9GAMM
MWCLWAVTLIWAFSFSLIDVYIAGQVDSYFAVLSRMILACFVFLPLLRPIPVRLAASLAAIGAIQLGLMFTLLYHAFAFLSVPEVLLFTVMTPVWVRVLEDLRVRRFEPKGLWLAASAVLGAVIIRYEPLEGNFWLGFALVQGANLCFAFGQVAYRGLASAHTVPKHQAFGWFFIGALVLAALNWIVLGNAERLPTSLLQWSVLTWLGIVASGLGYFGWNFGATRVSASQLAVMNNVLIPAGILVNLLLWNKEADLLRLSLGGAVMLLSLWLCWERSAPARGTVSAK